MKKIVQNFDVIDYFVNFVPVCRRKKEESTKTKGKDIKNYFIELKR